MEAAGGRRRKGQRLLYWFRTPPGVRVGRAPIDQEAIRLLEQHNPDVQFDWTRILKDPPPDPQARRERERDPRERDRRERRDARPRPRPAEPVAQVANGAVPASNAGRAEPRDLDEAAEPVQRAESGTVEPREPREPGEPGEPAELSDSDRASAAFVRLGAEGLVRLRARYAEVLARIAEKPMEEPAREELKLQAERLNPDGWVTTDEVSAALEQYETVFEGLRAVVGRHPRRRRRR